MKKLIVASLALSISAGCFAFGGSDIASLEKQQEQRGKVFEKIIERTNMDRTAQFSCFPDLEAPMTALNQKISQNVSDQQAAIDAIFNSILNDETDSSLKKQLAQYKALKKLKRQANSRSERKALKKSLKDLTEEIITNTKLALYDTRDENQQTLQENYTAALEKLTSADGVLAQPFNSEHEILSQCESKSCVYLVAAELKDYVKNVKSLNKDIEVLDKKVFGSLKLKAGKLKKRRLSKAIDKIAAEIAETKPTLSGDITSCIESVVTEPIVNDPVVNDPIVEEGDIEEGDIIEEGGDVILNPDVIIDDTEFDPNEIFDLIVPEDEEPLILEAPVMDA